MKDLERPLTLLRRLTARRTTLTGLLLVLEGLVAGVIEAVLLVAVVSLGIGLTSGNGAHLVVLELPLVPVLALTRSLLVRIAVLGVAILIGLHYVDGRIVGRLAAVVLRDTRAASLRSFGRASWEAQSLEREGSLQETVSSLATNASNLAQAYAQVAAAATALVALIVAALLVDPLLASAVLVGGGLLSLGLLPISRTLQVRSRRFVQANADFTEEVTQWTTLAMELQAFGVMERRLDQLLASNSAAATKLAMVRRLRIFSGYIYRDIALLMLVVALGFASGVSQVDLASIGSIALIVVRALGYAQQASSASQRANEFGPNLAILHERITTLTFRQDPIRDAGASPVASLWFQGVSYVYPGTDQGVHDLHLEIFENEMLGLIGPSGGGKTTIAQLALLLRRPTKGVLKLGGVPQDHVGAGDWRRNAAFVPQDPNLFAGTIADNVRFHRRGVSDVAIRQAAERAGVLREIEALPLGFATVLGPRGAGLSGGQKQRVAIARALAMGPSLLLLDEPTSALDTASEAAIADVLNRLRGESTIIIIAHRLSTIENCDRIAVVQGGRIVEVGPPQRTISRHLDGQYAGDRPGRADD